MNRKRHRRISISVRLTPKVHRAMQFAAEELDSTISDIGRQCIDAALMSTVEEAVKRKRRRETMESSMGQLIHGKTGA